MLLLLPMIWSLLLCRCCCCCCCCRYYLAQHHYYHLFLLWLHCYYYSVVDDVVLRMYYYYDVLSCMMAIDLHLPTLLHLVDDVVVVVVVVVLLLLSFYYYSFFFIGYWVLRWFWLEVQGCFVYRIIAKGERTSLSGHHCGDQVTRIKLIDLVWRAISETIWDIYLTFFFERCSSRIK